MRIDLHSFIVRAAGGAACLVALCGTPQSSTAELIASWTFEDQPFGSFSSSTDDVSGLIATPYNNPGLMSITLQEGDKALRFQGAGISDANGAAGYVSDSTILTGHDAGGSGFDSFTIEADVRISALTGQAQIVRKLDTSTDYGYELFIRDTGHVGFTFSGIGGSANVISKNAIAADGQWHHIQGTFVSDRDLYNTQVVVDGVVTRRTRDPITLPDTTSALTFGGFVRNSGTIGQRLDGWIDNITLSTNRADLLDVSGVIDPTPAWDSSDHLGWQQGLAGSGFIADPMPTPEIHAASITQRANGDMVAVWFGGTNEGHPDVGVWQSEFDGSSWSAPHEIAPSIFASGDQGSIFNPVIYQVPGTNSMRLFYLSGPLGSAQTLMRTSDDGGASWSAPQPLPADINGADRNQPVLLSSGVLVTPNTDGGLSFDRTQDFGDTWLLGSTVPDPQGHGGIQPAILEHADGTLQTLGRSQSGSIVTAWSTNGGRSWSDLELTNLPNNNSAIAAATLDDGRFMLVYNHSETPDGSWGGPRTPLNVALSDDGINWFAAAVLEDEEGEFSYPALYQSADGLVHIVYTWNRVRVKHAVLDPADLPMLPIVDGIWPDIPIPGDINGDGFVGVDDLNIILVNWNNGTPPTGGTPAIPEPASLSLLAIGSYALQQRYREVA